MADQKKRIYTVATAHLDTSWEWDLETTIREYIPKTLHDNFEMFEKYPDYKFSFEGSYRYELMEEYYPEEFEKLKEYVAAGRWNVTGSSYENGDMNVPSPESLFRNILYGNDYFDKKFGKRSIDIYLPDCFGFGWALPSIAHHANLNGFSTQKLTWGSAYGIPFDLGKWYGVDGNWIYASTNPGSYVSSLKNVRKNPFISKKLKENVKKYDLPYTYAYHGVGDRGGAPKEPSIKTVCKEISENSTHDIEVVSAAADKAFRDMEENLTPMQKNSLPIWNNELIATDHGVGSYTSRTVGKRWNRRAEQLADAAERSAVAADYFGASKYPQKKLDTCWKRIIAHQFHDDITGTSHMKCYERNWNDYMLSLNELGEEYRCAVGGVASLLDTSWVKGTPVVVQNPVQGERCEAVVAETQLPENAKYIKVFASDSSEVPAQLVSTKKNISKIVFTAKVPSMGYAVYDVRVSDEPCKIDTGLRVNEKLLENERYRVTLNFQGDISSIYDKKVNRDLLSAPIRMAIHKYSGSPIYPAWELDFYDVMMPPKEFARSPKFTVLEDGPARVSVEVSRVAGQTTFRQIISLCANGDIVNVYNEVDWRNLCSLLKVQFPLSANSKTADYDLGLGVISRGNNRPALYEVPAQNWANITDNSGKYGVSILSDSRSGWDKPFNNMLRLTCVHTPLAERSKEAKQNMLDLGLNRFSFGIYGHKGGFENGTQSAGARFLQPMNAFVTDKHAGKLSSEYSFGDVSNSDVLIRCVKKAQNSDEIVVRFQEGAGKRNQECSFKLGNGIASMRPVFASEEPTTDDTAFIKDGELCFRLNAYEPKTFAVTLIKPAHKAKEITSTPIELTYNTDIVSWNVNRGDGAMPNGEALPAEQFPEEIISGGVRFVTGPTADGEMNALICKGQTITVPLGTKRFHILAACFNGDKKIALQMNKDAEIRNIQNAFEPIGQWDMFALKKTGFIKTDTLGWCCTHTHSKDGDVYAKQTMFFKYSFDIPKFCTKITLPDCHDVIILAASVTANEPVCETATPLFDRLKKREFDYWPSEKERSKNYPAMKKIFGGVLATLSPAKKMVRNIDMLQQRYK